jgi:hypothetical protein
LSEAHVSADYFGNNFALQLSLQFIKIKLYRLRYPFDPGFVCHSRHATQSVMKFPVFSLLGGGESRFDSKMEP